jgi:hypothetical protein
VKSSSLQSREGTVKEATLPANSKTIVICTLRRCVQVLLKMKVTRNKASLNACHLLRSQALVG